jgi:hypothetical protein
MIETNETFAELLDVVVTTLEGDADTSGLAASSCTTSSTTCTVKLSAD